jgi:tetratricopeptide (TPR) repeat protein
MRLSAFVGRSFLDADKKVWHDLRDILDSLKTMGFEYEDGKEGQIRPISEKVRELILRHEIYIGVLTKRYPIWEMPTSWHERWIYPLGSYTPKKWTTSEWVIEEVGFAIGKDRKILLLIEKDVNFPTTDLDGDTQWVSFNRENLSASQTEISQMILSPISQRVTSIPESASVATSPPGDKETNVSPPEQTFTNQMKSIKKSALSGNFTEAERIQDEMIRSMPDTEFHGFWNAFLLRVRACSNDTGALTKLIQKCTADPSDFNAVEQLASVYSSFKQPKQASQLLISHLDSVPPQQRSNLAISAATALCEDSKTSEAISLLLEQLQKEQDESVRVSLYRAVASAAEKANNLDLEIAFLEKVVKLVPTDNDARFRLAYVYSDNQAKQAAAYHYKLVVDHSDWPGASNNLGVVYGSLGYKVNQFMSYERVAEKYPLAKANLAHIYASAGIHSAAADLANTVLATPSDDNDAKIAINRARFALDEIAKAGGVEKEAIDKIPDETKAEREFMCTYAEAYCLPPLMDDVGMYSTAHGDINIIREQGILRGNGVLIKDTTIGLSSLLKASGNMQEPGVTTYALLLKAQLQGQAGTFELEITSNETPRTLLRDSSRTIKGLMHFQDNGNVIQFLECDEKKRTVVSALRKL